MVPEYHLGNVRARCPGCAGAVSTFEWGDHGDPFGSFVENVEHSFDGLNYERVTYVLLRCAGCHNAGVAKIHDYGRVLDGTLEWFFPRAVEAAKLPEGVPKGIVNEYREAELCGSVGAWRAASGMLRSTLEKTLRTHGYVKGNLRDRIDEAATDGIITETRRKRAHAEVRDLGNDVLHDEWRAVSEDEYNSAHHYVQRIIEDFFDDHEAVEAILTTKAQAIAGWEEAARRAGVSASERPKDK